VGVVEERVDGRAASAFGISSSKPAGWMFEVSAIERFS
jgi:hypothetical protein